MLGADQIVELETGQMVKVNADHIGKIDAAPDVKLEADLELLHSDAVHC